MEKPHWAVDHEQDNERRFQEVMSKFDEHAEQMKEMLEILKPISETYRTASKIGKWAMALAVFVSIIIGIIGGLKSLLR